MIEDCVEYSVRVLSDGCQRIEIGLMNKEIVLEVVEWAETGVGACLSIEEARWLVARINELLPKEHNAVSLSPAVDDHRVFS